MHVQTGKYSGCVNPIKDFWRELSNDVVAAKVVPHDLEAENKAHRDSWNLQDEKLFDRLTHHLILYRYKPEGEKEAY